MKKEYLQGWFPLPNYKGMILFKDGKPIAKMKPKTEPNFLYTDQQMINDDGTVRDYSGFNNHLNFLGFE